MATTPPGPDLLFDPVEGDRLADALASVGQADSGTREEFAELIGIDDPDIIPDWWLGAAATAASFDLDELIRHSEDPQSYRSLPRSPNRLSLDIDLRRSILRELGSREAILSSARALPESPDLLRWTLIAMLMDKLPPLEEMSRLGLSAAAICRIWLDDIVPGLIRPEEIKAHLNQADLRAPLEKLVAHGFVGRTEELTKLADYVDLSPSARFGSRLLAFARSIAPSIFTDPPVLIHGPGGVGKSTLVAKFVLDHVGGSSAERLTFIYLDFDRASLRCDDPKPMFLEILRQVAIQHPEFEGAAREIAITLSQGRQTQAALESLSTDEFGWAISQIASMLGSHLPADRPILLVLDTFEEIQFLGSDVVIAYLRALDQLYSLLPQLRLVISGRAPIDQGIVKTAPIALEGFDPPSAIAFLRLYLERHAGLTVDTAQFEGISEEVVQAIARAAGGTPLTIALAGENLIRAVRRGAFDEPKAIAKFVKGVRADRLQQGLYGRILEHLHDPRLAEIAYPGLVLRRLDEGVILNVLAPACELPMASEAEATELMDLLRGELSLVEPEEQGDGVRHRTDVRRLMLDDIESTAKRKARRIEVRAAAYYRLRSNENGSIGDRAEELYHMMRLGRKPDQLERRWIAGVGPLLASAADEVPAEQRIWLLQKLNAGLELSDVANADQALWEQVVERRARRLLQRRLFMEALEEIMSRSPQQWLRSGPMFLLAAETHAAAGQYVYAAGFAQEAAKAARECGDRDGEVNAIILAAAMQEAMGDLFAALETLGAAQTLRPYVGREVELRFLAVMARLLTELGHDEGSLHDITASALTLLDGPLLNLLRRRPTLLREAAAVFGAAEPRLIKRALTTIGLDLIDHQSIGLAVDAIRSWDEAVTGLPIPRPPIDLATIAERPILYALGARENGLWDVGEWLSYHRGEAAKVVASLWARYPVPAEVAAKFALLYRDASSRAVKGEAAYA